MTSLEQLASLKLKGQDVTKEEAYIKGFEWAMDQIHVQIRCEYLRKSIPEDVAEFLDWYVKLNQDYNPEWPVK